VLFVDIQPWHQVEFHSDTAPVYSVIWHNIVYVVRVAEFPDLSLNTKLGIILYQLYYADVHTYHHLQLLFFSLSRKSV